MKSKVKMMKCCFILVIVLSAVAGQDDLTKYVGNHLDESVDKNLTQSIFDVFGTPTPPKDKNECVCVPYYQCKKDNTANTDGEGIIDIRIEDGAECSHYMSVCCQPPKITNVNTAGTADTSGTTGKLRVKKSKGCGYRNADGAGFRIIGDVDNEAQFGEFPWMVAILREESLQGRSNKLNVYQCGGALIHPQVVLTAAHCVIGKDKVLKIRAGEWDTQTTVEILPHQDRDVNDIIIHPQYYGGALFNDVALLILDSPVNFDDHIDVLCLPPQDAVIDNTRCFSSGWGKNIYGKDGVYQVILKKIDLPIVNRRSCQDSLRTTRLGRFFELHRSFICAGGEPGKDMCKGDGGSPLVCPILGQPNRFVQAGIVAYGIGCGDTGIPGVYANVAGFRNWINEQMTYNNFDTKTYQY